MSTAQKIGSFSLNSLGKRSSEDGDRMTMFDVVYGGLREKTVLQRLMLTARLPCDPADRTQLGVHYENFTFQLSKQHIWDHTTGLLLIYPSCLLHIIESSRDILISVLKDLDVMQQKPDCDLLEAKIVFVANNLESRMFQQWSFKVLNADQVGGNTVVNRLEEDEESTATLVCSVLSALQKLGKHLETPEKVLPGSVLDETPELIIPLRTLEKLFARDELLSAHQYLQMYNSPLNINVEFG
ncbi:testis-expressed protein 47 [Xenentodon cancila]